MPADHAQMARITELARQAFPDKNVIIGDVLGTWVLTVGGEVRLAHENIDLFEAGVSLFLHGAKVLESREKLRKAKELMQQAMTLDESKVAAQMEESVMQLIELITRALSTVDYDAAELCGALFSLLAPTLILGCDLTRDEALASMAQAYDTAKQSIGVHSAVERVMEN